VIAMTDEQQPKRKRGRPPGTGIGVYRPNRKRAAFIKAVADGAEPEQAAIAAGYRPTTARQMSHRLLRVAAVRAAIEDAGSTRGDLLKQLESAFQFAIDHKDAGAAVEAIRLRCVLMGLFHG
jgi:hypothetical protein